MEARRGWEKRTLGWLALALGVGLAIYIGRHLTPAIPIPSAARAPGVQPVESVPGGRQTPEYDRLQRLADAERAARARQNGASAVTTPTTLEPLAPSAAPATPPAPAAASSRPGPPAGKAAPASPPPADPLDNELRRAMQTQAKDLIQFRTQHFAPKPTRMVTFQDSQAKGEQAEAQRRAEQAAVGRDPPRDARGPLRPGDILQAVLQTAINSDEPGPVRARVVGERFKDAIILGQLAAFPPVAGSRPERVLVEFRYLTTPAGDTYTVQGYAVDPATARTALATGVDHHALARWGSLIAASFLEGYGRAVQASHRITTIGPFGNVVSVPKDGIDHEDIAREAMGRVGERLAEVVGQSFNRPNTVVVDAGTGIGVLIVAPVRHEEAGRGRVAAANPAPAGLEAGAASPSSSETLPIHPPAAQGEDTP